MFLQLSCGFKNEFQPPWTIGRHGSCNFSLEFARKWFSNFKKLNTTTNLVPEDVISFIDSIFKKDTLRIGDIVEIENILYPFAEIIWSQQDIAIGYKIINGQHYSLSSIITKEAPVLEFIYVYNESEICSIDIGFVDSHYKSFENKMYSYYTEDWYKILKTYRWAIKPEYKEEYLKVMGEVNDEIALKYQIELLQKIRLNPHIPEEFVKLVFTDVTKRLREQKIEYDAKGMFSDSVSRLKKNVNSKLKKYVEYFLEKLNSQFYRVYKIYLLRGIESQVPVSKREIIIRERAGVDCPFFDIKIFDFDRLVSLSLKLNIDPQKVIKCFRDASKNYGVDMRSLIQKIEKRIIKEKEKGK